MRRPEFDIGSHLVAVVRDSELCSHLERQPESLLALSWSPGLKETPQAPTHPEGNKKAKSSSSTEEEIFTLQVPTHEKHSPLAYLQE